MIKGEFGSPFTNLGSGIPFKDDYRKFKVISPRFKLEIFKTLNQEQRIRRTKKFASIALSLPLVLGVYYILLYILK